VVGVLAMMRPACAGEELRAVPHSQLVDDLREGRVERLDVCPVAQLAEAEGVRVYEDGELCD
jgi:hypothetical protein